MFHVHCASCYRGLARLQVDDGGGGGGGVGGGGGGAYVSNVRRHLTLLVLFPLQQCLKFPPDVSNSLLCSADTCEVSTLLDCYNLSHLLFLRHFTSRFSENRPIKLHENPSIENRVIPYETDGKTDTIKLVAALHNFAKSRNNIHRQRTGGSPSASWLDSVPASPLQGFSRGLMFLKRVLTHSEW